MAMCLQLPVGIEVCSEVYSFILPYMNWYMFFKNRVLIYVYRFLYLFTAVLPVFYLFQKAVLLK